MSTTATAPAAGAIGRAVAVSRHMRRAAAATAILLGVLAAWRLLDAGSAIGGASGPPKRTDAICFGLSGAVRSPGLRCVSRPSVASIAPLAPCDEAQALDALMRLLDRCPMHGGLLVLAPRIRGGPCVPRLRPLGGAARLALGLPIDLLEASAEDLDALPGVGPRTAERILARRSHLRTVDDLGEIPGIGPVRLAAIRPHVAIGAPTPSECR